MRGDAWRPGCTSNLPASWLRPAGHDDVQPGHDRALEEPRRLVGQRPQPDQLVPRPRRQHELADVDRPVVAPQRRCQTRECRSAGRCEQQPDSEQAGCPCLWAPSPGLSVCHDACCTRSSIALSGALPPLCCRRRRRSASA